MVDTLTIAGKQVGRRRRLFPDYTLPYPPAFAAAGGRLALRDFIAHVVRAEVAAFQQRQEERRLFRALTAAEIAAGADRGRIDPGGRAPEGEVDAEEAVATALQAFGDGIYFVFIDGVQQTDLEATVLVAPQSTLTFVRLVALAGG
jgi:hypothetical protein